jgi:hypothetical protein
MKPFRVINRIGAAIARQYGSRSLPDELASAAEALQMMMAAANIAFVLVNILILLIVWSRGH